MGANQQFRRNKKLQTIILKKTDLINGHFRLLHNLPKCDLKQTAWQLLVCNQNMYPFGVFFSVFVFFTIFEHFYTEHTNKFQILTFGVNSSLYYVILQGNLPCCLNSTHIFQTAMKSLLFDI